MGFKPLHDRVLIRPVALEKKTSGGVIIPDTAQEKPMEGEAVAVGPGTRDEQGTLRPMDVQPSQRVLLPRSGRTLARQHRGKGWESGWRHKNP